MKEQIALKSKPRIYKMPKKVKITEAAKDDSK